MLENSYDASGIKFGMLFSPTLPGSGDEILKENLGGKSETIEKICVDGSNFIEFSNFDGLTPTDALNICPTLQSDKVLILVVYNSMKLPNCNGGEDNYIRVVDWIPIIVNDRTCNVPIDQYIVNHYLRNYSKLGCEGKKQARCFLQRYKYGTKEWTDEILKEKVYKKEDNK